MIWLVVVAIVLIPSTAGGILAINHTPVEYKSNSFASAGPNSVSQLTNGFMSSGGTTSSTNNTPSVSGILGASAQTNFLINSQEIPKDILNPLPRFQVATSTAGSTNNPAISTGRIIEGANNQVIGSVVNKVTFAVSPEPKPKAPLSDEDNKYSLYGVLQIIATFDTFASGSECVGGEFSASLQLPNGNVDIPATSNTICANSGPFTNPVTTTSPLVQFQSPPLGSPINFVVKSSAFAESKPVPSPLPILGIGSAFAFSRKIRKKIKLSAKITTQ